MHVRRRIPHSQTRLKGASFPKTGTSETTQPQNLDPQKGIQNSKSTVFVLLAPTLVGAKSSRPTERLTSHFEASLVPSILLLFNIFIIKYCYFYKYQLL